MSHYKEPIRKDRNRKKKIEPVDDSPTLFTPAAPYRGQITSTGGHSGTVTSEERALNEVITGEATERQKMALQWLSRAGETGMTWKELDSASSTFHHGKTSGMLSVLHQTGQITRLREVRNRCLVYVLPQYVNGRPISPIINTKCVCGKLLKPAFNFCPTCGTRKHVDL